MFQRFVAPAVACGITVGGFGYRNIAGCSEDHVPEVKIDWDYAGMLSSYDYASVRRGFQVYRQVCASCHSLDRIAFRNLVGVTHDESGARKIAESYEITDGPNDEGEMFERPGKLSDKIPSPYKNEEEARMANSGALPPDLSLMVKARHGGANYLFSLLTGYMEPPAGKAIPAGLHYNPYFPGGAIAMAKQLTDGQVEYEDGTPATVTQMAKDVTCFLQWAAEPEHDERKLMGFRVLSVLLIAIVISGYYKRMRWSPIKTRKITFTK